MSRVESKIVKFADVVCFISVIDCGRFAQVRKDDVIATVDSHGGTASIQSIDSRDSIIYIAPGIWKSGVSEKA